MIIIIFQDIWKILLWIIVNISYMTFINMSSATLLSLIIWYEAGTKYSTTSAYL